MTTRTVLDDDDRLQDRRTLRVLVGRNMAMSRAVAAALREEIRPLDDLGPDRPSWQTPYGPPPRGKRRA